MPKMPQSWIQAGAKPVAARLDMGEEVAGKGKCPECKQTMTTAFISDVKVMVCVADRIALPVKDDGPNEEQQV